MTSIGHPVGSTPNYHVNNEQLLISAVLHTEDLRSALGAGVEPEWFSSWRQEWDWIVECWERLGRTPSISDFQRHWPSCIVVEADDVMLYVDKVRTDWVLQRMNIGMSEAAQLVASRNPMDIQKALETLRGMAHQVQKVAEPVPVFDLGGDYDAIAKEAHRRYKLAQASSGTAGAPWGMPSLDRALGGRVGALFGIVAARTNVGKSWLLFYFALRSAMAGKDVLIFSQEMDQFTVSLRIIALESYLNRSLSGSGQVFDPGAIRQGTITKQVGLDFSRWVKGFNQRIPGSIKIVDRGRGTVSTAAITAVVESTGPHEVFVDGLQIVRPSSGSQGEDWQTVGRVSADLFELAQSHQVPVIASSQINRSMVSHHTPPDIEGLSRSDAIGQDADVVITATDYAANVMRVKIAKSRLSGGKGHIFHVAFEPHQGRIEEVDAHEAEQLRATALIAQGVQP